MHRLFYISTANPGVNDETITTIMSKSVSNNLNAGISGALAFNGLNFAQVLEGEEDDVVSLFDIIKRDDRHSGVILISQKEADDRVYANWGMKRIEGLDFDELVKAMAF